MSDSSTSFDGSGLDSLVFGGATGGELPGLEDGLEEVVFLVLEAASFDGFSFTRPDWAELEIAKATETNTAIKEVSSRWVMQKLAAPVVRL